MAKLFAVMLIICTIYTSIYESADPVPSWNNTEEILCSSFYEAQEILDQAATVKSGDNTEKDFIVYLKELGYYKRETNDEDLNRRNAVVRFQSDHNLTVDGIWGKNSNAALQKRISDDSYHHTDQVAEPPSEGLWIAVNKTKRILTLYYQNYVVKKYPIAVGNPSSLTPSGKFTILNKVVNPAWGGAGIHKPVAGGRPDNPLGYRWMGLSLKGGYTYGIHGNNSPYSIGKDISLGCIRMINSDVEELFEIVTLSTKVWIGTDKELTDWGVIQKPYAEHEETYTGNEETK